MIGNNLKVPPHRPVLVVFFEELKADPAPQLARMLEFLEVPTSPKMINATVMVCTIVYMCRGVCQSNLPCRMASLPTTAITRTSLNTILLSKRHLSIVSSSRQQMYCRDSMSIKTLLDILGTMPSLPILGYDVFECHLTHSNGC